MTHPDSTLLLPRHNCRARRLEVDVSSIDKPRLARGRDTALEEAPSNVGDHRRLDERRRNVDRSANAERVARFTWR